VALLTHTQVIKRPVEEVFATVIDAGNFASWNPTIKSSRSLDEGEIGNGSRFEGHGAEESARQRRGVTGSPRAEGQLMAALTMMLRGSRRTADALVRHLEGLPRHTSLMP
jgi:hypothetical protein